MGTLAAGIKEIFATAKTTGSNVMLCGNDGTPDGHIDMANLASVLGECVSYGNGNINLSDRSSSNYPKKGVLCHINSGSLIIGAPSEITSRTNSCIVWVDDKSNFVQQYIQELQGDGRLFVRDVSIANMTSTTNWVMVTCPPFYKDYGSLSALANALGVTKRMEFVDLGLPSGTLWATRNLGAETPEDYGYYFSWGNVIGRKPSGTTFDYNWGTDNNGNYASTPGAALTGDIPTNMDYDAVQRYMGGSCKMPTTTQFVELFNSSYTTNEWITKNGVNGRLVTSKINGNSIFFPAAGYGYGTSLDSAGSYGNYWSRSLNSSARGYILNFDSSNVNPQNNNNRFVGFSVRAVQ